MEFLHPGKQGGAQRQVPAGVLHGLPRDVVIGGRVERPAERGVIPESGIEVGEVVEPGLLTIDACALNDIPALSDLNIVFHGMADTLRDIPHFSSAHRRFPHQHDSGGGRYHSTTNFHLPTAIIIMQDRHFYRSDGTKNGFRRKIGHFVRFRQTAAPPRAAAVAMRVHCGASAAAGSAGRPRPTIRATTTGVCTCTSTRRYSTPAARRTGPTVNSCVASRNKRKNDKYEPVKNAKSGCATVVTVAHPLLLYLDAV